MSRFLSIQFCREIVWLSLPISDPALKQEVAIKDHVFFLVEFDLIDFALNVFLVELSVVQFASNIKQVENLLWELI